MAPLLQTSILAYGLADTLIIFGAAFVPCLLASTVFQRTLSLYENLDKDTQEPQLFLKTYKEMLTSPLLVAFFTYMCKNI